MIGILIVAHGTLGESLIQCANHVLGNRPEHLMHLDITVRDDPDAILPQARELIQQLDQGEGVLVLSDIYGATPCNIVCRMLEPGKVEALSGVNLPMLIRALTYRNETLPKLVDRALSGSKQGILHITMEGCDVATKH